MRVLLVTHQFPPGVGGIETHSFETAKNMAVLGHRPLVLTTKVGNWQDFDGSAPFGIHRMPSSSSKLLRLILTVIYTALVTLYSRSEVIYCPHWRSSGIAVAVCSLVLRTPFFIVVHGTEIVGLSDSWFKLTLLRWVASRSCGMVASTRYQQEILGTYGIHHDKVFLSPQGVDISRFAKNPKAGLVLRNRLDLGDSKLLLTVARLVERKGHDQIIQALPQVLSALPNTYYLIVGTGAMVPELKELAVRYGVHNNIRFCGYVADEALPSYYNACDLYVMPNREVEGDVEGFGISFVEAGACAKPVIGGASAGVVHVIAPGVTGLTVDPLDNRGLAEAIIEILSNPVAASQMGEAGHNRVRESYDFEIITSKLLDYMHGRVTGRQP